MVNKLTNTVKPLDEVDKINEIIDALDGKQDTLVSGANIKTINNNSILGSGNLALDGLPSQTGNANKFLTTDGTNASWAAVPTRNIGEIVESTIPLIDAGLHLLDGSLIQGGGIYSAFVDYMADLYADNPTASYFAQPSDASWVQPVLTSNGTMGGDSFAVNTNVAQLDSNAAWHAFDGVTSGGSYFHSQYGTKTGYIDMYNPVPIKITNFKIYNQIYNQSVVANRASSAGIIYGSDNGSDWTQLSTYTNSVQTGATWNIDLSSNTNYYKYYRMESTAGGSDSYWVINEIQITAVYQQTAEETWQSAVTTYGVCGKFVYDSTNNTVRLPKITGILEGTTDVTALGDLVEAGLPNITGQSSFISSSDGTGATGAFGWTRVRTGRFWENENNDNGYITFDASRSNSIYGNSSTVQPQTIKCYYYIVIATSTKTDIEVDIDEIATDLNSKADVDLTNCTKPHIIESYVNGTSWYRVYSDGWCEQGGSYSNITTSAQKIMYLKPMNAMNALVCTRTASTSYSANNYYNLVNYTSYTDGFLLASNGGYGCWYASGYLL